jgi:hypothetical protein
MTTFIGVLTPEATRAIMSDIELMDDVIDLISASRETIQVKPTKRVIENGETYFVSFMLNVDNKLHQALEAEAKKQQRTIAKLLRRYAVLAFKICLEDVEEVKEGA